MLLDHIIKHGLLFAGIVTGYLFLFMIFFSPRIWGYSDYPDVIKKKVPPQTKKEKLIALVVGIPWFVFVLVFPIVSSFMLKSKLGGEITFFAAFLNLFILFQLAAFGDLVILDWLIVSKITPDFVMIPGTEKEDYKDFSHHYKGHARAAVIMSVLSLIVAALVVYL